MSVPRLSTRLVLRARSCPRRRSPALAGMIVLVGLAAGSACVGDSRRPVSATAGRLSLSLDVETAEHSKDSHERRAVLVLRDGALVARRSWSGYWERSDPPAPATTRTQLTDTQIEALAPSEIER